MATLACRRGGCVMTVMQEGAKAAAGSRRLKSRQNGDRRYAEI